MHICCSCPGPILKWRSHPSISFQIRNHCLNLTCRKEVCVKTHVFPEHSVLRIVDGPRGGGFSFGPIVFQKDTLQLHSILGVM